VAVPVQAANPPGDQGLLRGQVARLLERPGSVYAAYQPIVDLSRAVVVGYESLARFTDSDIVDVEGLFTTAKALGVADLVEALALAAAFEHRASLPANCFLTVNVSPPLLASQAVRGILDRQGDLGGVVIELTEQTAIDSYVELEPHIDRYRAAGALIAVDDTGSGYAGLRHLIDLRPSIIKVDRHFVHAVDRDPARQVMIEMLGIFADRTDCWLLAEGVERPEELDTLVSLGVPLVQGYLTGRPAPPWTDLPAEIRARLGARPVARAGTIGELVQPCRVARSVEEVRSLMGAEPDLDLVVLVDGHDRPREIVDAESAMLGLTTDALRVNVDTPVAQAAGRAVTRRSRDRFMPLAATTDTGELIGVVRIERLVEHLAAHHVGP
jgi:EAL domain-containing protein (putative c-di-GMP-specific phosphodiesterase class I)